MAEWSNAAVLKTVDLHGSGGSNPSLSAIQHCKSVFYCERSPKIPLFLRSSLFFKYYIYCFLLFFFAFPFPPWAQTGRKLGHKLFCHVLKRPYFCNCNVTQSTQCKTFKINCIKSIAKMESIKSYLVDGGGSNNDLATMMAMNGGGMNGIWNNPLWAIVFLAALGNGNLFGNGNGRNNIAIVAS